MPEAIKAKAPSFYRSSPSAPKTAASGSNLKKHWPIIGALVLVGVAVVFFLRSRSLSSSANVGPALTLYPDTSADSSGLANAIQGARALGSIQRSAGSGGDTVTTLPYGSPIIIGGDNSNTSPGTTPINVGSTTPASGNTVPGGWYPSIGSVVIPGGAYAYPNQPAVGEFAGNGTFYGAPLGAPSGTISSQNANKMYDNLIAAIDAMDPNTPNANKALGLGFDPNSPEAKMTVGQYKANVLGITGTGGSVDINKSYNPADWKQVPNAQGGYTYVHV